MRKKTLKVLMECELKCFVTSAVPFFHNVSSGVFDFAGGVCLCIWGVTLNGKKKAVAGIAEKAFKTCTSQK